MTEVGIPSVPDERAVAIWEFSAEAREAAAQNIVAADMYHQVQTGNPEAIRQAAQWIVTESGVRPRSLHLDDDDYLTDQKLTHLITAGEKVTEAERIESWAGSLLEVGDSPDIVALKSLKRAEGLFLPGIEKRPWDMLKFEDDMVALGVSIATLRAEIADISEKLDQGIGLETVNVVLALKQSKPKASDTVTAVELASLQREILTERAEAEEARFRNRTELMEALRTGQLSEGLREAISDKFPENADSTQDEDPLDYASPIEDLGFSVRTYNCLFRSGINTIGELVGQTEGTVRAIVNLGDKSFDEILEILHQRGLSLSGD